MKDKLKWIVAVVIAMIGTALALLYGKKPLSVLNAQIRAHNARSRVLTKEMESTEKTARAAESEEIRKSLQGKADKLRDDRVRVEKLRLRAVQESGDLPVSDVDLARRHNASRRTSVAG